MATLAHNLLRWVAALGLGVHGLVVAKTIRRRFIALPGRLTHPARRRYLHLPSGWPWAEATWPPWPACAHSRSGPDRSGPRRPTPDTTASGSAKHARPTADRPRDDHQHPSSATRRQSHTHCVTGHHPRRRHPNVAARPPGSPAPRTMPRWIQA
jgi:hypothetical protein